MKPLNANSRIAPKNIMWATDFSPAAEAALPYALALTHRYGSELYMAHVVSPELMDLLPPGTAATTLKQARESAEQRMGPWLTAGHLKAVSCRPLIGEGVIWDVLLDMVRQNGIDLIIVGTHGRRGLGKLLLGSVAEEVFRMAPCPVLTVGPKTPGTSSMDVELSHILYPVEFVPDTSQAAGYVISLAEEYRAKLTIMNVLEGSVPKEEVKIQDPVSQWMNDHMPAESDLHQRTSFELGFGHAAEAILKFATDYGVDLIVMSVRRLDPMLAGHLPESDTAYEVVRTSPCPVLTVR